MTTAPDDWDVMTASFEEYWEGAGPTVAFALQTGCVGPMEKLACRIPAVPVPVIMDDVLLELEVVLVAVEDALVSVEVVLALDPKLKCVTTTEPHSSPAAAV